MKKIALILLSLLLTVTADAVNSLSVDSISLYGNRLAQLTQQVEVSMRNDATPDYEGRLYLMAYNQADGSLTPCADTLVNIKAGGICHLVLYPTLPEGELLLSLNTDAGGLRAGPVPSRSTYAVTIQPLRKLDLKATFSLDMLTDNAGLRAGTGPAGLRAGTGPAGLRAGTGPAPTAVAEETVLYGSRIRGWVKVENHDTPYFGTRGGRGDDDGIVLWIEDRDSGERLFTKHVANSLDYYGVAETTFAYDAVFRDGARYALKAGYGMPYGLEPIDSLCFTTRSGTNTYWTAKGEVLPLPVGEEGRLTVPTEAVAVDLRGQQYPTAIDASQANPNCLYYLDLLAEVPQGLDGNRNLVHGLEAESIRLTEGHDYFCPLAFRAQLISYLMKPSYDNADDEARGRGYSETLVLPFRPTHVSLYDINGETEMLHADMLKVLAYHGYSGDSIEVYQLNDLSQMHAYEPYLLGVYIGSRLLFTGENTYVPMTREAVVRGGGLDFAGTTVGLRLSALLCVPQRSEALPTNPQRSEALPTNLQRSEALPTNYYVYSPEDYCFRMGDAGDVIAPFHAYMYAPDNLDYGRWGISDDVWGESGKPGDATAIDGLRVGGSRLDGEAVCDLQGRKVAKIKVVNRRLPKGIYITGGQKVIVK